MLLYLFKRVLFFIPTLFVITLVAFAISVSSPVDPVDSLIPSPDQNQSDHISLGSMANIQHKRQKIREQFNLHLPSFYFRLASLAEPDTFYRIYNRTERRALGQLLYQNGNWPLVQAYHHEVASLSFLHSEVGQNSLKIAPDSLKGFQEALSQSSQFCSSLLLLSNPQAIGHRLAEMSGIYAGRPEFEPLNSQLTRVRETYLKLEQDKSTWKNYVPCLIFHGFDNQYHKWISGILLRLDFGKSYQTQQAISGRIGELFFWTVMFTLVSVILAYLISIPMGILGAAFHESRFDRISTILTFALDSLPSFVVATLLLILFANPDVFSWFPASFNVSLSESNNPWQAFWGNFNRLVLPLVAYTYGQVAFLSRIMRSSMLEVVRQDYIRTARAKGLRERWVLLRHALRNAALPIITTFAGVFPALIGGHVILESIFSIPGMGREILRAITQLDIPMVMGVFTLVGCFTILGYLISDLLYSLADPRISYHKP